MGDTIMYVFLVCCFRQFPIFPRVFKVAQSPFPFETNRENMVVSQWAKTKQKIGLNGRSNAFPHVFRALRTQISAHDFIGNDLGKKHVRSSNMINNICLTVFS